MSANALAVGDVVQIDPAHDKRFGGCFMVVTEPKSWGAQGYVAIPGEDGVAYYRAPSSALLFIGIAEWALSSTTEAESPLTQKEPDNA